jgi:pilus assembly protein Flp/PilA
MIEAFLRDESGASAAEYGLILAIIGVGMGAAALALGANVAASVGNGAQAIADTKVAPSATPS